jgi:tetratricopeptide (TPR) repeat protein
VREALGEDSPKQREYLDELGTLLLDEGRAVEAEVPFRRSMALSKSLDEFEQSLDRLALGRCLSAQKRWQEAAVELVKADELLASEATEHPIEIGRVSAELAEVYQRLDRQSEAGVHFERAQRLLEDASAKDRARLEALTSLFGDPVD